MSLGAQHALRLLAEALAGRPVHLEFLDEHEGWPDALSLPDPTRIDLPVSTDQTAQHSDLRARVLHHWALIESGTFGPSTSDPDPDHCLTHPVVESSAIPALAASLLVMLEHFRVVAWARRRYPGAASDLDHVLSVRRRTPIDAERADEAGLVAAIHLRALGARLEEATARCPRVAASTVEWLWEITDRLARPGATVDDTAVVVASIVARLVTGAGHAVHDDGTPDDFLETPTAGENAQATGDGDEPPGAQPDPGRSGRPTNEPDGDEPATEQLGVGGDALPLTAEIEQADEPLEAARGPVAAGPRASAETARVFHYDEWNDPEQRYHRSWCRLLERRALGTDLRFADKVRKDNAALGRQIRHQLNRLRPQERVRVHRVQDGEELDLDAAIESIVDRRSGAPVDDRVTMRRDPARRDVATAFLVDLSASTSSPILGPEATVTHATMGSADDYDDLLDALLDSSSIARHLEDFAPKRRIIDVAKESVLLMGDALDELGDRYAVYGFSGHGRHNVEFCVAKDLDEPASAATATALGAFEPIRYTRMGPAVRHAAAKLATSGARTRLLIVISDGHPQDSDYGPDRSDKSYGVEDTAKAIREAAGAGIDAYCLTIDPSGTDYLGVMFAEQHYLVIDDIEALPTELAKLYSQAARPAQRRAGAVVRPG